MYEAINGKLDTIKYLVFLWFEENILSWEEGELYKDS